MILNYNKKIWENISILSLTCSKTLSLSKGAVHVLETDIKKITKINNCLAATKIKDMLII